MPHSHPPGKRRHCKSSTMEVGGLSSLPPEIMWLCTARGVRGESVLCARSGSCDSDFSALLKIDSVSRRRYGATFRIVTRLKRVLSPKIGIRHAIRRYEVVICNCYWCYCCGSHIDTHTIHLFWALWYSAPSFFARDFFFSSAQLDRLMRDIYLLDFSRRSSLSLHNIL